MGLMDRDYMRRDPPTSGRPPGGRRPNLLRVVAIAGAVIGVASAGLWLYRDARGIVGDFGPHEGSLRVNINSATQEELESVPGIGPTRAAQIIAGRPWPSVDDLERLSGIGPAQVEQLRPFLKAEGETEKR
jgi:competence ComEA-like helix-hairpin-helix protein